VLPDEYPPTIASAVRLLCCSAAEDSLRHPPYSAPLHEHSEGLSIDCIRFIDQCAQYCPLPLPVERLAPTCRSKHPLAFATEYVHCPSLYLRRYHNQCLPFSPTTAFSRFLTAKVCFINLTDARESISCGPHHRTQHLLQPRPRRLETTQPQNPLQPLRIGAILLAGHSPDCPNVHRHGQSATFKDRSGLYRNRIRTGCTFARSSAGEPHLPRPAWRACKPLSLPHGIQVLNACRLRCKLTFKFFQGLWILLRALGY